MKKINLSYCTNFIFSGKKYLFGAMFSFIALLMISKDGYSSDLSYAGVSFEQQKNVVSGVVVDATGAPVIGAFVLVDGTTNGVSTDADGRFSLSVEKGKTITISCIGYASQQITIGDQSTLNIVLKEDSELLDEVVVIGYGVVKKADLAGAVSVVDNKNFKDQPITQTSEALQGRVSGVQVENSGIPGGSVKIRVRGANSINKSNDPLYVVDGIVRESGLDGINPEDIQSLQVLKDASSTAIYGSRGANGVVIITTKTGKANQSSITFDASVGVSSLYKRYDVLSPYDYAKALTEYKGIDFTQDRMNAFKNGTAGVDWQDEIFRTALTQNYKLVLSKGNEDTQYYISANYMGQEGIVTETNIKRYQAKMNINSKITNWLTVVADINASHGTRKGGDFSYGKSNTIWRALNYSPAMDIMDENGIYIRDPYNAISENPLGGLKVQGGEGITDIVNGKVDLRFNIVKGLTFTTTNGVDYLDSKWYSFGSTRVSTKSGMGNGDNYRMMLQSSNNLTYLKEWDKHRLTATAVYEATSSESRSIGISGTNLLTEGVKWWNVGLASSRDASNGYSKYTLSSLMGRLIYNYADRYLFTGTFRRDGSSRFMKDKWGNFWSVAGAWTLSNEEFMKDFKAIQDIKLRASYGVIGNQDIAPYSTLGLMSQTSYNFGTTSNYTGYWANDIPTPNVTWEDTYQFDLGLEFSAFNRRLHVSVDYFNKLTKGALLRRSMPNYVGGTSYWVNEGEISNKGLDLTISASVINNDNFTWNTTLNGTYLKNNVEKLATENDFFFSGSIGGFVDNASIVKPGYAIGSFYGYRWAGINKDGLDTYYKANGEITTTPSGEDKEYIGKASPDFTFGWNNSFSYKNWDLNMFFNAAVGAYRLNLVRFTMASMVGDSRFITLKDAYTQQGKEFPKLDASGNSYQPASTKWLEKSDYLRLENISLSYNLSKKVTKFADLRFTLSCQNLFTLTGYKGMDPAGSTFSGNVDLDAGMDMGAYPTPRTVTFGVRMNF